MKKGLRFLAAAAAALILATASGCGLFTPIFGPSSQESSVNIGDIWGSSSSPSGTSAPAESARPAEPSRPDPTQGERETVPVSSGRRPSGDRRPGIADTVAAVEDCVVAVNVTGVAYDYFYGPYPTKGAGSGVIISSDGYIVTNSHVVADSESITVFLSDGNTYPAKLIGRSAENDIAVIKIDAKNLTAAVIGESGSLRVGDSTFIIGNPLGELQGTVTVGYISGLKREIRTSNNNEITVLQTDAAVNPGNSGGGMFDFNGTLIGIVVAKSSATEVEGLGFVIPIDTVLPIVSELITRGYVSGRPYIGLYAIDITSQLSLMMNGLHYAGVYVNNVDEGSPADVAGLRSKDLIVSVNGTKITDSGVLYDVLGKAKIGDVCEFEIYRVDQQSHVGSGEKLKLKVTVGENKS